MAITLLNCALIFNCFLGHLACISFRFLFFSLQTPVYLCYQYDLINCAIRIILQDSKGIQILNHSADQVGSYLLDACAKFNSLQVIHLSLKTLDTKIYAMNNYCCTPLHLTALKDNDSIVQILIQAGINTKVMDWREIVPGKLVTIKRLKQCGLH